MHIFITTIHAKVSYPWIILLGLPLLPLLVNRESSERNSEFKKSRTLLARAFRVEVGFGI